MLGDAYMRRRAFEVRAQAVAIGNVLSELLGGQGGASAQRIPGDAMIEQMGGFSE